MARAYGIDLRERVIGAASEGISVRQAAARFEVGISTAIVWVRRFRASGEKAARKQGKPCGSKLDIHEAFLLDLVEKQPDLVQRFVDASAIGWYHYIYGDSRAGNDLIKKQNPEMTDALLSYSIAKMKEYGIVDSGDSVKFGIDVGLSLAPLPARFRHVFALLLGSVCGFF